MGMSKTLPLILLAVALTGCGAKKLDPVGKWTGAFDAKSVDSINPALKNMTADLEIRADKTFSMNLMIQMEGTWVDNSGTIVLTPTKMAGVSIPQGKSTDDQNETLQLVPSEDGKSYRLSDPKKPETAAMIFTRKA